jgi:3'(2'), 5'-bisphosphate nucleotidase
MHSHSRLSLSLQFSADVPVDQVILTAEKAGKAILQVYNGEVRPPLYLSSHASPSIHPNLSHPQKGSWQVQSKKDDSPLTLADTLANQIICQDLMQISPHVPIVSEENENATLPHSIRKNMDCFW